MFDVFPSHFWSLNEQTGGRFVWSGQEAALAALERTKGLRARMCSSSRQVRMFGFSVHFLHRGRGDGGEAVCAARG